MHSPKVSKLTDGRDYLSLYHFFCEERSCMKNNIRIYEVKSEYINYLSHYQKHIFAHTNGKDNRKYKLQVFASSRKPWNQPAKDRIRKNAEIVYSHKKRNGVSTPLAKRTNDFELLENLCQKYWNIKCFLIPLTIISFLSHSYCHPEFFIIFCPDADAGARKRIRTPFAIVNIPVVILG